MDSRLKWIMSLAVATVAVIAIWKVTSNPTDQRSQKLVAVLPLTGDLSFLGDPGKNAIELAAEAEGVGANLEAVFVDSKADPKEAVTAIRREIDVNSNSLFVVTLSGPSLAAKESFSNDKIALLSIAIHPDVPSRNSPIIRFCISAKQEGEMIIDKLNSADGSFAVVASRDGATTYEVDNIILPALENEGKTPAWIEWFDVGQKDFKNLSAKLRQNPVERILLLGYGSDFDAALNAVATLEGHDMLQIIGGIGFVELATTPSGFVSSQFEFVAPAFSLGGGGEKAESFRSEYKKKTGKPAPYDAAFSYDAFMTVSSRIKDGTVSPQELLDSLRGNSVEGVTGKISWDASGEATTEMQWGTFDSAGNAVPTK